METKVQSQVNAKATHFFTSVQTNLLQRKCACGGSPGITGECAECNSKRLTLQRRATNQTESSTAPPIVQDVLRSSGQPLDESTRDFMESRFGHDFSRVRVHTDAPAAESARAVSAHAYTVGRDIVFAAGQFAPQSQSGLRLIAHELTHVVQQEGGANLQRNALELGPADDFLEREADRTAEAVARLQPVPSIDHAPQPLVQRDLARPPRGTADPLVTLTPAQIQDAITFNQSRFTDPYSIRTIRDIMGGDIDRESTEVNEEFVQAVVQWQAEHHLTQDGKVGYVMTRSIVQEMAAESRLVPNQFIDAVALVIDSYRLPTHWALTDLRVGSGRRCCGTEGDSDAETLGGPQDPIPAFRSEPIRICICFSRMLPKVFNDYDGFVRIIGHELVHVPQHQSGTGSDPVNEFEAWFWEVCSEGRVPLLSDTRRASQARIALSHFRLIPASLLTTDRVDKATKLQALITRIDSGNPGGSC